MNHNALFSSCSFVSTGSGCFYYAEAEELWRDLHFRASLECMLYHYSMIMHYDSYCAIRLLVVWNCNIIWYQMVERIVDEFQKTIIVAFLVTVAAVFLLFLIINTSSEPKLNEFRFENQSCSCSNSNICPYSQSCHRLLGTNRP
jgi:hypothetical protein